MNDNTSRVVEYTLVILIGLIISYVMFVQQQADKDKFDQLKDRVDTVEQKVDDMKADKMLMDLKIKQIDEKVNPKTEEPALGSDGKPLQTGETDAVKPETQTTQPKANSTK
ncbi:MAG: hypothetical protein WCX74_01455 [Candidatus Paceibacterota bacterium]